ncbi:MAG: DNA-binding transcriptional regulator [Sedimentisphaerales bacterium]|nr:DNA-binding transcriptional regulator [Sedimentisphaerales bacterium]
MHRNCKKVVFLYSHREDWGIWDGVVEYASLHGQWLLYSPLSLQFEADDSETYRWLNNFKPDGIIVPNSRKNLENILKFDIPIIVHRNLKERIDGRPAIIGDGNRIGEMAAEHLIKLGFTNFAYYVCENEIPMQERAVSFTNRVDKAGFKTYSLLRRGPKNLISWDKQLSLLSNWLKSIPKPVAIMAGDDVLAVNILMACRLAELLIPQQIAVLGINNTKIICETQIPKISSVALSYYKAGFEAAELLDKMMEGEAQSPEQTIVIEPTNIVTRQSTDFSLINDYEVGKAMNFIHQNSAKLLQVIDVAEQTNLSGNVLQRRFKKAVGCSISQEIRRACADKIADMLLNSNMSISDIARTIGFSGDDHISRYFRQSMGMTPLDYRKKYGRK